MSSSCFIFDFDCTLTISHWYYFLENFNHWKQNYENIDENMENISNIISKFKYQNFKFELCKYILKNKFPNFLILLRKYFLGDIQRNENLKTFFDLIDKSSYDIFIVSRGYKYDIELFLYFFKFRHIKKVYARKLNNKYIQKNIYFKNLVLKGYNIIKYIDDDHSDHLEFKKLIKINKYNIDYVFYDLLEKEGTGINLNIIYKLLSNLIIYS